MPDAKLMVTGGVSLTQESLLEWFSAGANCVGIGSQLVPKESIASGDFGHIRDLVKNAIAIAEQIRGQK